MKLAYAIDSLGSGGAQRQAAELAIHLKRQVGVSTTVLVYHAHDFYGDRLRHAGVPIVVLPKGRLVDVRFVRRFAKWLRQNSPDVLHAFMPIPAVWSYLAVRVLRQAQRPLLIAAERDTFHEGHWLENATRRLVYPRADAVTVNAACMAGTIADRFGVSQVHYIPNGIDLRLWDEEGRTEPPYNLNSALFNVALVGGLRRQKNHLLVLDAVARLAPPARRRLRVWFVGGKTGEPGYAEEIRDYIVRRGLSSIVKIVPPVHRIAAVMRRFDVLVLPSHHEGFPNVILEAMASRVPVIASAVGDVPNMIDHGRTGFVLGRNDASSLAAALELVLSLSPQERAAIGKLARQTVESRYALPLIARQYLTLYRTLGSKGRVGGREGRPRKGRCVASRLE